MAIVSTRPGIKAKVGIKFPAKVSVTSPLTLTKTGGNYVFGVNVSSIIGGDVWVWQLQMALASIGQFYAVDEAVSGGPATTIHILWNRGTRTSYDDTLSTFIESIIGTVNTQTAYNLAPSMIN